MNIYAISDLHLPLGVCKPMDIFGCDWDNYVNRIFENWSKIVKDEDVVIICGDVSWATYLVEAYNDFKFINSLPGQKVISKGNHDYWWTTLKKLESYVLQEGFNSIHFLHNNAYRYQDVAVCAARGWITPAESSFNEEDDKIYKRELIRLELSINEGRKTGAKDLICAMHYPPLGGFLEILEKENIDYCVYGHLHGDAAKRAREIAPNIKLVSADFLEFSPIKVKSL